MQNVSLILFRKTVFLILVVCFCYSQLSYFSFLVGSGPRHIGRILP